MSDDKNFEQEYQYVDESGLDDNQNSTEEVIEQANPKTKNSPDYASQVRNIIQQPNIRRNGLIAVGALVFLIFLLKFMGKDEIPKQSGNTAKPKVPEKIAQVSNPMLQAPTQLKMPTFANQNVQPDRLNEIERNLQSNLSSMRDQIGQLSNQVNNLTSTNQALNTQISELSSKLLANQRALEELIAVKKSRPAIVPSSPMNFKSQPKIEKIAYYVQAVIPGRAWLISSQGTTLTVRVGSKVPGLGVVHRIDELQGRVLMSTGHIIAFAQAD